MPERPVITDVGRRAARFSMACAVASAVPEVLVWSGTLRLSQFVADVDHAVDRGTAMVAATTLLVNLLILGMTLSSRAQEFASEAEQAQALRNTLVSLTALAIHVANGAIEVVGR